MDEFDRGPILDYFAAADRATPVILQATRRIRKKKIVVPVDREIPPFAVDPLPWAPARDSVYPDHMIVINAWLASERHPRGTILALPKHRVPISFGDEIPDPQFLCQGFVSMVLDEDAIGNLVNPIRPHEGTTIMSPFTPARVTKDDNSFAAAVVDCIEP